MDWMIKAIESELVGIRSKIPIRERLASMRGPRLRWWLWQVYCLSIGMTRATSRAVSRAGGELGMVHFGNLCNQARSWMATSQSMASIVAIASIRTHGSALAESTTRLMDALMLEADSEDEINSAISLGLVAEPLMCSIIAAVDAAPWDAIGGISASRSSYWTSSWTTDITAPVGRIEMDSPAGVRLSGSARRLLRSFEDAVMSWHTPAFSSMDPP
jgi:hypothetical protein